MVGGQMSPKKIDSTGSLFDLLLCYPVGHSWGFQGAPVIN